MIRAPALPGSASSIVGPRRAASHANSTDLLEPHPPKASRDGEDEALPLAALLGSWHICASTLPLWDSRRSVQAHYAWPPPPTSSISSRLICTLASLVLLLAVPQEPLLLAPALLAFRCTRQAAPAFLLAHLLLHSPAAAFAALLPAVLATGMLCAPAPLFLDEITSRPRQQGAWSFTPATLRGQNVWDPQRGGRPGGPLAFAWRGRSWLRPLSARWQVLGWGRLPPREATANALVPRALAVDGPEWLLTYFEATRFTPVGLDIYARRPLSAQQLADVRQQVQFVVERELRAEPPPLLKERHACTEGWRCLEALEQQLQPLPTGR